MGASRCAMLLHWPVYSVVFSSVLFLEYAPPPVSDESQTSGCVCGIMQLSASVNQVTFCLRSPGMGWVPVNAESLKFCKMRLKVRGYVQHS